MRYSLLDTDILSAIMRRQLPTIKSAETYLATHKQFTFSIITRYEILRGLKAKDADKQIGIFEQVCRLNEILPLSDNVVVTAASIYGDLRQRGEIIGDADILIAATAIVYQLPVVTNNVRHFQRIPNLELMNWNNPS